MERNERYPHQGLTEISVRLAWAQVEIFSDDVDQIQVIGSGDERSLTDLKINVKDTSLIIEQPQYGLSLDIKHGHWMQICVRVPKTWDQEIHVSTITGFIGAWDLGGNKIVLETVTEDMKASRLTAKRISLRTTTGNIRGDQLVSEKLSCRSINGNIELDQVSAEIYRCTGITGEIHIATASEFQTMDLQSVSGNIIIHTDVPAVSVKMRTISGQKLIDSIDIVDFSDAPAVHTSSVSGDLKIIKN